MSPQHHPRQSPVKKKTRVCNRFSIRDRIAALKWCSRKTSLEGWSQRRCGHRLGVDPRSLRNWHFCYTAMLKAKMDVLSLCVGPKSQLMEIEDELLKFIFERREQGFAVSRKAVVMKASKLLPMFSVKSNMAKYSAVRRFLNKHDLVYRVGTHVSQKDPHLTVEAASDFVKTIRPFLYGPSRHPSFILNMDQTPVFYSMHKKSTLATKGSRSVNLRTSKNESERITVAVTISAAGDLLQPTIVFKGEYYSLFDTIVLLLFGLIILFNYLSSSCLYLIY